MDSLLDCNCSDVEGYRQYKIFRREDGRLWELGRGAMGITYKAYDTALERSVALKVISHAHLGSEIAQERFLREARAAASLRHENVASVFYLGTAHQRYFYTMEFVDGETVHAYVKRRGALEPREGLNFALQVSSALAAGDKQRLVHRDLKPSNLMLVYDKEGKQLIKVIDFGLAKSLKAGSDDSAMLTKAGGFVGTPQFVSPEQVEGRDIDIRSDIYSLGVTLYFMLTGQPPFSGSNGQIVSQHLYKPVPMAPLANSPRSVISLIQRMTEKDRNKRPQTPRDLEGEISACLEQIRVPSDKTAGALVKEHVQGPTLQDLVRARGFISAAEVARLLVHLAPLADHAQLKGLQDVDFTLSGIQLTVPEINDPETHSALLLRPITVWKRLDVKVSGIDFSVSAASASSWARSASLIANTTDGGPRSSYVRPLSLLGYELLGGPRVKVETEGRFTPLAAIRDDGNTVLRRGISGEFSSAVEMATALAECISGKGQAVSQPRTATFFRPASSPRKTVEVRRNLETSTSAELHTKRNFLKADWRWLLAAALIGSGRIGLCLTYYPTHPNSVLDITPSPAPVSAVHVLGRADTSTRRLAPKTPEIL